MDHKILLLKSLILIYRESQLEETNEKHNNHDFVRTVLGEIKIQQIDDFDTESKMLNNLQSTIFEIMDGVKTGDKFDIDILKEQLSVICKDDPGYAESIISSISKPMEPPTIKRTVTLQKNALSNYFRETKIQKILDRDSYTMKYKRNDIGDLETFIQEHCRNLESHMIKATKGHPGVVSSIDINDETSLEKGFDEVNNLQEGHVFKTGWQSLNDALEGGIRRPEFVGVYALKHRYKTGFTLSLFDQLCRYNKPVMIDPNKKPCIVRISAEDDLALNLQFLYQRIMYQKTKEFVSLKGLTSKEMSMTVKEELSHNGYYVKMIRIKPTEWTYKTLIDYILDLIAEGYEIHACIVDYILKIPTTGCPGNGTIGSDTIDMLSRLRDFFAEYNITFISPFQLSTEAFDVLKNGVEEEDFTKAIENKGMTGGSRRIGEIMDIEMAIHSFRKDKKGYLSVNVFKHKGFVIDPSNKSFYLSFPSRMPLPDDINEEPIHLNSLREKAVSDNELFNF